MPPLPPLDPPLLNSSSLWASTLADLTALYTSPHTGAITTRTACDPIEGFDQDDAIHQHTFSSISSGVIPKPTPQDAELKSTHPAAGQHSRDLFEVFTLNTYGYSPYGLCQYVYMAKDLERTHASIVKPVIFSVAGDAATVDKCFGLLTEYHSPDRDWCLEINLSCPNIAGKPPPAYSRAELVRFLAELRESLQRRVLEYTADLDRYTEERGGEWANRMLQYRIPIGLKLPPYTYAGQFDDVVEVVRQFNREGFGFTSAEPRSEANSEEAKTTSSTKANDQSNHPERMNGLSNDNAGASTRHVPSTTETPIYPDSFVDLLATPLGEYLRSDVYNAPWPIAFITATNTLGSSLVMQEESEQGWRPAISSPDGTGVGGLAGAALHPLALGNVANLKRRLRSRSGDACDTSEVKLIGVGGVADVDGFRRMRAAGADAVGIATALGARGVAVFEDIAKSLTG